MSGRGKKKGGKVIATTVVVLGVLVVGIFAGTYFLLKDAANKGVQFDGQWTYNGKVVLDVDYANDTYTLEVDDIKESGTVKAITLVNEDLKKSILEYTITLEGNKTHDVDVSIHLDEAGNATMIFKGDQYKKSYTFEQPAKDKQ